MSSASRKRAPKRPPAESDPSVSAQPMPDAVEFGAARQRVAASREAQDTIDRLTSRNAALDAELQATREALQRAEDSASRASRLQALGQVASGVAHDFNNALTTILGISDWLVHELPEDVPYRGDIETIRTAAQDAAAMVRRLQMFGRLAPGNGRHEPTEIVDLSDVAKVVADLARPRCQELAVRTGRPYDVVVDGAGGPTVLAAAAEIRELLINLVFNALDAMPDGGIIRLVTRMRDGMAEVVVIDSGTGMTDDVKARIFEPFFSTKGTKGTGLGLSVCATIAERHGATLGVESTPGSGTTFTLAFPAPKAATDDGAADLQPGKVAPMRPLRVLVVDDESDVCDSLAAMVAALGHGVGKAAGGAAALQVLQDTPYDVVVTDLGMAEMNGLELAARVTTARPATAVVLVTAWGVDFGATLPESISTVVAKPATLRSLQQALSGAVASGAGRRAGGRDRNALAGGSSAGYRQAPILDGMEAS
jgi:signal transduction histidine kinase/ActR/RegA family two-component response regulator